jgi:hypothetical protein
MTLSSHTAIEILKNSSANPEAKVQRNRTSARKMGRVVGKVRLETWPDGIPNAGELDHSLAAVGCL